MKLEKLSASLCLQLQTHPGPYSVEVSFGEAKEYLPLTKQEISIVSGWEECKTITTDNRNKTRRYRDRGNDRRT